MSSIAKLLVANRDQFHNAQKSEIITLIRSAIDPEVRELIVRTYLFGVGHTMKRGRIHAGVILCGTPNPEQCYQTIVILGMMNRVGAIKSFTDDGWLQFSNEHLDATERSFIEGLSSDAYVDDKTEQEVAELFVKDVPGMGTTAAKVFQEVMNLTRPADVSNPTTGGLVGGRLHST